MHPGPKEKGTIYGRRTINSRDLWATGIVCKSRETEIGVNVPV